MAGDTMKWQGNALVQVNREVKPGHFLLRISTPEIAAVCRPGQFLHVLCGSGTAPLLRRPVSICRVDGERSSLDLIYRVVGEGTRLLSLCRPGDVLDVMGPLGTPFSLPVTGSRVTIVGGGVGIPPLLFLAETLRIRQPETSIQVLLGGRSADFVLCESAFTGIGCPPAVATDDGSLGHHGLVTDLLRAALFEDGSDAVYACGPTPMLESVAGLCRSAGVRCQVSFEARMACGVGACLSCVIPTRRGYQRVCTEGPVFDADEIDWATLPE